MGEKYSHVQPAEAREMFLDRVNGMTQSEIAQKYNRTNATVARVADKYNWNFALHCISEEWQKTIAAEVVSRLLKAQDAIWEEILHDLESGDGTGIPAEKRWDKFLSFVAGLQSMMKQDAKGPRDATTINAETVQVLQVFGELDEDEKARIRDRLRKIAGKNGQAKKEAKE